MTKILSSALLHIIIKAFNVDFFEIFLCQKEGVTMFTLRKDPPLFSNFNCSYSIMSISSIPLHMHQAFEIVFVLKGSVHFSSFIFNGRLSEGDIFIVNVNDLHSIHAIDEDNLILLFHFNPYKYDHVFPHLSYYWFVCDSYKNQVKNDVHLKHLQKMIFKIVHLLFETTREKADEIDIMVSNLINYMINHFQNFSFTENLTIQKSSKMGDNLAMKRIFEIQEYIYINYMNKIALDDISKHLFLNKYYVSRLIKKFMGLNLTDLLGLIRTKKAEILLITTDLSIEQIALECGFSGILYFEKYFKRWNKVRPSQYRIEKIKELTEEKFEAKTHLYSDLQVISAQNKLLNLCADKPVLFNDYIYTIDLDKKLEPFSHYWEDYVSISDLFTGIQLISELPLEHCKNEVGFQKIRLINFFETLSRYQHGKTFFDFEFSIFLSKVNNANLNIEFYILPTIENCDEISSSFDAFLSLINSRHGISVVSNWSFVVNTINMKNSIKECCDFCSNLQKNLEKKQILKRISIISVALEKEVYSYDSMRLVPDIINLALNKKESDTDILYRELFDIPGKKRKTEIPAFARNGLFGPIGEKKPIYHIWHMLSLLGEYKSQQEEGLIVTKKNNDFYILIYDCENRSNYPFDISPSELYFTLNFKAAYKRKYNLIQINLDSEKSLLLYNKKIGYPISLSKKYVHYLNVASSPEVTLSRLDLTHENAINLSLRPFSAKLLIFEEIK